MYLSRTMKHGTFRRVTEQPLNGAPTPERLVDAGVTRVSDFFVRNHGAIPPSHGTEHTIRIHGACDAPCSVSVATLLAASDMTSLKAALQCAGNRRDQVSALRPTPGELPWTSEAVGQAEWGGVPLSRIIDQSQPLPSVAHVWFVGADMVTSGSAAGQPFGGSVPIADARRGLLALTMNGEPLSQEHGAPVRVVVPGVIAARSVKWVTDIILSDHPSDNYFQQGAYRLGTRAEPGEMLNHLPLNSAIMTPSAGSVVAAGTVAVRGWATPRAGARIVSVECSPDDGATWTRAQLLDEPHADSWARWQWDARLEPGMHRLCCRATDTAGDHQPADPSETWNERGYLNNAWHRVDVVAR